MGEMQYDGGRKHVPSRREPALCRRCRRRAFTLIEILIVVVILGILAAIVIPQFSNASITARENTLKDELRYLRTQIVVYKAQHRDVPPGPDADDFVEQMTGHTDDLGNISASRTDVYKFGPYLSKMPTNTINGKTDVKVVANDGAMTADDTTGWIYRADPLEIIANSTGSDVNETPYAQY
jgi:general secretion pathway protein G